MSARLVTLIFSDDEKRGRGTEEDPTRYVRHLYTLKGTLVATFDTMPSERQDTIWNGEVE